MNYATFRDTTIKLLNQFSASGNLTPLTDSSVLDAVLRFPTFAQTAQLEIATTSKYIHRKKVISQNPIPNLLSQPLYTFDIQAHFDMDLTDMCALGAKSYSFEVDNLATIYIEEEYPIGTWNILKTLTNTVKGQYTIFKGFTNVSDVTHNIRIRFSGDYPYNIRNKALWAYMFPTEDDIPQYSKINSYLMGDDYFKLNKAKCNDEIIEWSFEGRKYIGIPYNLIGEIEIHYFAYPTPVPSNPADDWTFDLDEEACQAIPFYVASQVLMDDPINKNMSSKLYSIYQSKLANMENIITNGAKSVKNTMFTIPRNTLYKHS